jgi:hypothetical protein
MAVATKTKPGPTPRTATRTAPAAEVQRVGRSIVVPTDRVVATGRDGKPIWRKSQDSVDKYAIPHGAEPDGWKYEWKRKSIFGKEDVQHQVNLNRNGWTDVPASRHDGVWMPAGHPGSIEIDGLVLMEIPIELHREARAEDKREADRAVGNARRSAGMPASSVADPSHPEARKATYVRAEATPVLNQNKYEYVLDE